MLRFNVIFKRERKRNRNDINPDWLIMVRHELNWTKRITIMHLVRLIVFRIATGENRYWYYDSESPLERKIYVAAHVRISRVRFEGIDTLNPVVRRSLPHWQRVFHNCLRTTRQDTTRHNHLLAPATTNSRREPAPRSLPPKTSPQPCDSPS